MRPRTVGRGPSAWGADRKSSCQDHLPSLNATDPCWPGCDRPARGDPATGGASGRRHRRPGDRSDSGSADRPEDGRRPHRGLRRVDAPRIRPPHLDVRRRPPRPPPDGHRRARGAGTGDRSMTPWTPSVGRPPYVNRGRAGRFTRQSSCGRRRRPTGARAQASARPTGAA
jgi:hypothetical protein